MKKPQQRRSAERRQRVLEAAIRLLAREGPRAVTHRAVAAEAGTSTRATTYYFRSRDELLTAALLHYAETALDRFERIQRADPADGEDPLEVASRMLADTVMSDLTDDRTGLVAEYELVLEIHRRPELADAYARWQDALVQILARHARALGSPSPERHARLVLATLRGLEIEALASPSETPRADRLRSLFRELLAGLASGGPPAAS